MYNLIIFTLLVMLTPTSLRHDLMKALLEAISIPLQTIANGLVVFRVRKTYEMALSSQIIYLEKMLNDRFNPDGIYTPIYITDALVTDEKTYTGQIDEEDGAVYVGQKWVTGTSSAATDEEFLHNGSTWKSLVDANTTDPVEGASWTEVADDEMIYIGYQAEYAEQLSFVVHITISHHTAIESQMPEMSSYINKYKLLGTKYTYIYEED